MPYPYNARAYRTEYQPAVITNDLPAASSSLNIALRRWAVAHRRSEAAATGMAEAVSRYRRALAAGDGAAMALQAGAATRFAADRLARSREKATAETELVRAALPEVRRTAQAVSAPAPLDAVRTLEAWRILAATPVFVEMVRELGGAQAARGIVAAQSKGLDTFWKKLEARVLAADLVRAALPTDGRRAEPWPQPPDLASLLEFERRCASLVAATAARRIELVPAAGETIAGGWWAIRRGDTPRFSKDTMRDDRSSGPLAPGVYDIYLCQRPDTGDQALPLSVVRLASSVPVDKGGVEVRLTTGLRLVPAEGLPVPHLWFVTPSATPVVQAIAARRESLEPVWLLPGAYDIYWIQSSEQRESPLRIASAVQVSAGRVTEVHVAAATVRVTAAAALPETDERYGGHTLVQAGDPADRIVQAARAIDIVVPPGVYDVYWRQDYDHLSRPLLIGAGLVASAGAVATLTLDSGLELRLADWVPPRDATYGWWGIVPLGTPPDHPVHWITEGTRLAAPPGVYSVYWVQDYNRRGRPLLIASPVVVTAGNLTPVPAASGVRLNVASWVPPRDPTYGWWGIVTTGDSPEARLHWTESADALLAPPGRYDVYWVQGYDQLSAPLLIASDLEVVAGAAATVSAVTGIALDVSPRGSETAIDDTYGWWGVVRAGEEPSKRLHWSKVATEPLMVPPGVYDVVWKRNYNSSAAVLRSNLEVTAGSTGQLPVRLPVQLR